MFSRSDGHISGAPKMYADCERRWNARSSRSRRESVNIGYETELYKAGDCFKVLFHGHCIVKYYPTYKQLYACGYGDAITTLGRLSSLSGAQVYRNTSLGFHEATRINGYPFFEGIRVDNAGHVLPEDIRPDYKRRVKKDVQQAYNKLFRWLKKQLAARWDLGEFDNSTRIIRLDAGYGAIARADALMETGCKFLPYDIGEELLCWLRTDIGTFNKCLDTVKKAHAAQYFNNRDAYYDEEISNG